ncbi:THAP-type domain-containing protein [Aphis craccivora]|uniref:THAP-type domain-containing protein n=1 Tax=Aphis craccivora TaxID=307492 RepID=A0A6G0Z2I3_APHCR|nr:THAP-type domain-containing protein [Aphis craccivora]
MTVENGNCTHFDIPGGDFLDFRCEKRNFITENSENIFESDINNYLDILNNIQQGEYSSEILDYIAGYSPFCVGILLNSQSDHN